jgi:membrane-bound ClpP family serine protease
MWILFTIGLIILLVGLFLLCAERKGTAFMFGVIGAYIISGAVLMLSEDSKPTAMDVYQGKTTLEITYKDGVPVDSVVVFKNKVDK